MLDLSVKNWKLRICRSLNINFESCLLGAISTGVSNLYTPFDALGGQILVILSNIRDIICKICRLILSLILFPGYVENESPLLNTIPEVFKAFLNDTIPEVFKAFLNAGDIDLALKRLGRHCCKYHGNNLLFKFSKLKITS